MANKMHPIDWIAIGLLIIGGLNWGLVGAFSFNLVEWITGGITTIVNLVYIVVGLAALYSIYSLTKL